MRASPCLSSMGMAQPDHRLHSLGDRWLSDAAFGPTFDGCQADACGYSIAERRSSRRPPRCSTAATPVHVKGLVRGPDDGLSASLVPSACWSVHPDPAPS